MTTKEISPILTVTDFEKDDPEYQLMKDFYKLFKVLYQVKDNDRYYAQAMHLFDEFYQKYHGNDIKDHFDDAFLTDLINTLGAFIDRKAALTREPTQAIEKEREKEREREEENITME